MWLGIDDTDSPRGGCTTWVMAEVVRRVAELGTGIDLVGAPRLVRLNPNVPFKTRGNAALSAQFGRGEGARTVVGARGKTRWWARARGRALSSTQVDQLWDTALEVVRGASQWGVPGTDPTVVLSPRRLPPELYRRAVREPVRSSDVLSSLSDLPNVRLAAYGSGEGVVGAAASVAWPSSGPRTWEIIAYRAPSRWGTPRHLEHESVGRMERAFPETFLSSDAATRRVMVAPHTPCPVLFGVRAKRPERLPEALGMLRGERPERWMIFATNQATGDHLSERSIEEAAPGTSGIFTGRVASLPETLRGGHTSFQLEDPTGSATCVAFEPSKTLPVLARELRPGDRVEVWGSVPGWADPSERPVGPPTVHLEGIRVVHALARWEKSGNPRCSGCSSRMRSLGRGKGFRCDHCRRRLPPERSEGSLRGRSALQGSYLPTPSARRHLAPLGAPRRRRLSRSIYSRPRS